MSAPAPLPSGASAARRIRPGTPIPVVLTTHLVSGDGSAQGAQLVTMNDVRAADGEVLLPAGSPVLARVSDRRPRRLGRAGGLEIELIGAMAPDGSFVRLSGMSRVLGQRRGGLVAGLTVGMLFVYPPFNFFHLMHRGRAAQMPSGYVIQGVAAGG